jgi:hypothetical protein
MPTYGSSNANLERGDASGDVSGGCSDGQEMDKMAPPLD